MRVRTRSFIVAGVAIAIILAGFVSFYASAHPDGLGKVGELFNFNVTEHATKESPLAGYATEGVDNDRLSGGIAGILGVLVTFAVAAVLFVAVRKGRRGAPGSSETADSE